MRNVVVASLMYLSAVSCGGFPAATQVRSDNRDVIAPGEFQSAAIPDWSVYDAIAKLRPHFLKSRSAQSLRDPQPVFAVVYLDNIYYGDLESMKDLKLEKIESIRYLNPYDAGTRFGMYMGGGAIMISTH